MTDSGLLHCTYCGNHLHRGGWPKQCSFCNEFNYNSPKPIATLVLTAWDTQRQLDGFVIIKRGIEPFKDAWAFPGGYVDHAEDWRDAAVREAEEEIGVHLRPKGLHIIEAVSTQSNFLVLFIGSDQVFYSSEWDHFDMTKGRNDKGEQEVLDILVMPCDSELELGVPVQQRFRKRVLR